MSCAGHWPPKYRVDGGCLHRTYCRLPGRFIPFEGRFVGQNKSSGDGHDQVILLHFFEAYSWHGILRCWGRRLDQLVFNTAFVSPTDSNTLLRVDVARSAEGNRVFFSFTAPLSAPSRTVVPYAP